MRKLFDNSHSVTISPSTIIFAVFFILGLYFLYFIQDIVFTVFLAVILMSALHPALRFWEKKLHLPKIAGILVLYLLIISVIGLTFALIVPPLAAEVPVLISSLHLPPLPEHIRTFQFTLAEINNFVLQLSDSFSTIFSVITSTFRGIFTFLTVLVMTAYMLLDRDNLHKKTMWFTRDEKHLKIAEEFINSLEVQLGGWVRGQLFLMLTIGIMSFIGLSLLSVPFALPLALLSALLEILPNLGPAVAVLPGVIIAYTTMGPAMSGIVLILYLVIQQLENHIIVPRIMKQSADVSPLVTIIVILIGFKMAGVLGALLSVPVYILFRTVYSFWMREADAESN